MTGFKAQDEVWFSETQSIRNYPFLIVNQAEGFQNSAADGLIGLCPMQSVQNSPPSVLDLLFENGLITSKKISFSLRGLNEESVLLFGEPDYSLALSQP